MVLAEAGTEPFHQRREGVDGEPAVLEVGRPLVEMDGGQLEQPDGMIGDDDRRRRLRQLLLHGRQLGGELLLLGAGRPLAFAAGCPERAHVGYPNGDN